MSGLDGSHPIEDVLPNPRLRVGGRPFDIILLLRLLNIVQKRVAHAKPSITMIITKSKALSYAVRLVPIAIFMVLALVNVISICVLQEGIAERLPRLYGRCKTFLVEQDLSLPFALVWGSISLGCAAELQDHVFY